MAIAWPRRVWAYYVIFTDRAIYEAAKAAYPHYLRCSPSAAAAMWGIPYESHPPEVPEWFPTDHAYVVVAYRTGAEEAANNPPIDQDTFFWTDWRGDTYEYAWIGKFFLFEDNVEPPPPPGQPAPPPIPRRRWVIGFEAPGVGQNTGVAFNGVARVEMHPDASRHVGGIGLAIREPNNDVNYNASTTRMAPWAGTQPAKSWERFYIRLRNSPTKSSMFWAATSSGGNHFVLGILPSKQLGVWFREPAGTYVFYGAFDAGLHEWDGTADDDAWARIDVVMDMTSGAQTYKVYANGTLLCQPTSAYVSAGAYHQGSKLGNVATSGTAGDAYIDVDDWINSEVPAAWAFGQDLSSMHGSKVIRVNARGWSANHTLGAWTGDWRSVLATGSLRTQEGGGGDNLPAINTTTAGALFAIDSDLPKQLAQIGGAMGIAGGQVGIRAFKNAAGTVQLGYSLNGAAAVMDAKAALTAPMNGYSDAEVLWPGPSTDAPSTTLSRPTALELRLLNSGDANSLNVFCLQAQVEVIGDWTAADGGTQPKALQHVRAYPHSPWAQGHVTQSPYLIVSGTYVGNGTGQDLTFPYPVTFLVINRTTGAAKGPLLWNSAAMTGSQMVAAGQTPLSIAKGAQNLEYVQAPGGAERQFLIRINNYPAGGALDMNTLGTTFHYVAICDPGMRFSAAVPRQYSPLAAIEDQTARLPLPGWNSRLVFSLGNILDVNTLLGVVQVDGQDPEKVARLYNSAAIASAAIQSTGPGAYIAKSALITVQDAFVHLAWRTDDGSLCDAGNKNACCQVGTYVGDGVASRPIYLAPSGGRRPLLVIVAQEGAGCPYYREPSHTGTNSTSINSQADVATAITAGAPESFTVGSSLNTNGVRFVYWAVMGSTVAGNNGWSIDGSYEHVEQTVTVPPGDSDTPPDDADPPIEPPDDDDEPDPLVPDDMTTDVATGCVAYTTRLVNRALAKIGISKQIASIATDTTEEAYQARLHYGGCVEEVLRDHAWSFATRYHTLVQVLPWDRRTETPSAQSLQVNGDWQYAFSVPADCVFARRIVPLSGLRRKWEPNPIAYRLGELQLTDPASTDLSPVLFTNEIGTADNPLILEFTARVPCPASRPDSHFREALSWKLASALVAPLARDTRLIAFCDAKYQDELHRAGASDQNEQQQEKEGDADWIKGR